MRRRRTKLHAIPSSRCRASWRTRKSLALVFAVVFAPATSRSATAGCVPFSSQPAIGGGSSPSHLASADFDRDGDLDVLGATYADATLAWFENTAGDASAWSAHEVATNFDASFIWPVLAADVDADVDVDLAAAWTAADKVAWFENDGAGGGWTLHTVTTGATGAFSVSAGDVDRDGDADLLSASSDDDSIAWCENHGTKVFTSGFDSESDPASANLGCWSTTVP